MKKLFLILVLAILSFVAVLAVSNKVFASEKTATEQIEELLEEYLGEGQYTKLTTLAYDEKEGNYHAGANQRQRRTYYDEKVNALLMGDYDGKFEHINSGYALDGADMVHYRNNAEEKTLENLFTAREENYAVLNENPVDFYDVLSDIKNKVHNMQLAKSEQFVFENGVFTYVNEKGATIQNGSYDDGFLKQMQYFAAPMLLLNNGIKLSKVNIFEAETINDKKVLVMQLYTIEGNLVSTALVLKGLTMNAVELKFKMLSNKTTWSYPMGQEAENYEDGQYRLYRVSLEKGQALKLTNVCKWLGYDELENKDDFDVDNDKNILVKESGKYDIYIKNNGSQVYIGKSKALYELKQGNEVLAQEEDRQIEGKDHAVFEQNLEKGSIVKVAKEGELLHFYVNDEDKGTAYQTEAPGLHIFYVNNEDKVYVTAPSYVLLMDGAVQANAGIDKGNDNAKFRIELAKDAEIQIKKDEAKLDFYVDNLDVGDTYTVPKNGIYIFYVNASDEVWPFEEIQAGAWKLLSDTLGWDYETKGELLQASGEDFVLNRYDLKAGEKFKLCNRKNWLGYNDLTDLSKALFGSDESGNIIIQDAGKYDICLHEDGTFEISKSAPIFTLKVNGTLAGQAIEKGDNQAAFEVTLAKNDTVIIEKDDVQYGKEYKAPRAGLYQIYINQYGDFWAEEPAKVYALEVNEGAPSTEYLVPKTDEKNHAEFELNLQKGDKVIITLDEAALSQPHGDEEEPITLYTAPRAGKYHFYVNENDAIYVTEPDPQYAIKVNESDVEDVVLLDLQNGDKAAFKFEYLPKGNVITIEKDGETLGTPYTTPRAGEYEFYVNSQEEISVVAPEVQYVIKLNGESQKGKEITNTDPNNAVVYKLENLAAGSIVVIEKDEETLYFYHSGKDNEDKPIDVKDDNQYTVEKLSNITFYVNKKGEVWTNVEVIEGPYKFVSSREAIAWDYEKGTLLEAGTNNQKVLLEFELAAGEEFKLSNRKDWYGYSHLEDDCKGLFEEGDNIKVKDAGKYDIYLKESGYIWIAKSKALYELKVDGNVEKSMKEVAGDYHAEFSVELTKGQKVKIEKEKVLLGEEYTAPRNGIYTFKVTNKDIIEVVAPNALYELKVNGNTPEGDIISGEALGNNHVIYELQLAKGDKVIIKKDGESLNEEYQAPRKGTYKFYVNGSDEVYPVAPKVLYELKVDGVVKDAKEKSEEGNLAEFTITLTKGATFTIEQDEVQLGEAHEAPRAGEYKLYVYIEKDEVKVSVVEPDLVYSLKVNDATPEVNYQLAPTGNNIAEFKITLAKGDKYKVEKDDVQFGELHTAPRAGEYKIYVYTENEEVKVSIVEPAAVYAIKLNGTAQSDKEIANGDNKAAFELSNLANDDKIVITEDGEALYFYHNDDKEQPVKDGNEYTVTQPSNIKFYVDGNGRIWIEVELIAGDYKFVSSRTAINWDYEEGIELEEGSDDQLVLLEFELTKDEEFKLYNRKYWNGYSKLEAGCKALFIDHDDNIKVNETGKYNIYLKSDGSMWIEIIREHKFVSDSVGWNYANGVELTNDDANKPVGALHQWKLESQEMASEEKFKLFDGNSSWLGYSSITVGTDLAWNDSDSGNIKVKVGGSYNIKLIETTKGNYSIELEKNPEPKITVTVSVKVGLESDQSLAIAGDYAGWSENITLMTKGSNNTWTTSLEMEAGSHSYKLIIAKGSNYDWDSLNSENRNITVSATNNSITLDLMTIYLEPNIWDVSNVTEGFAAYFFGGSGDPIFVQMTSTGDGKFKAEIPHYSYTKVIFVRGEGGKTVNWDNKWNQTDDITDLKDHIGGTYKITSWSGGSWQ